jgi:hypothetical protein
VSHVRVTGDANVHAPSVSRDEAWAAASLAASNLKALGGDVRQAIVLAPSCRTIQYACDIADPAVEEANRIRAERAALA